ncbi:MAG: hypothetical protein IPL88_11825 [Rhizobiales bacterium]|nr:hypothetical protein [Hyphomicrobiales bacterium]
MTATVEPVAEWRPPRRHREERSDEAIQRPDMDCFAALAMTWEPMTATGELVAEWRPLVVIARSEATKQSSASSWIASLRSQ